MLLSLFPLFPLNIPYDCYYHKHQTRNNHGVKKKGRSAPKHFSSRREILPFIFRLAFRLGFVVAGGFDGSDSGAYIRGEDAGSTRVSQVDAEIGVCAATAVGSGNIVTATMGGGCWRGRGGWSVGE
jgi:hypothetical protein